MTQSFRLENVGLINRSKKLSFKFNGKNYYGYEGDTLASALIANGVHLVGRSFKYHRPRGFFGVGVDEPYAIVQLYRNGETEPNIKATEQELFEGLEATSVNCWPSVNFDIGAINNFLRIFLPAGFYYKTFMWPKSFWYKIYEPFIRKAAGLGVASTKHDKERYEHKYEYCDLLIAGSGPSGLSSAYAAAKNGAKVILAEDKPRFGGSLLTDDVNIGNQSGKDWAEGIISELKTKTGKGSKRFVGISSLGTNPRKKYKVSLGVWNKDVYNPEEVIAKWNEMKVWGKENNRDLRTYFDHKKTLQTTKLFTDVCIDFLEAKQKTLKPNSFASCRNRLNQIQNLLTGNELVTDFAGTNGRGYIKRMVLNPKIASGVPYTAHRYRRLLNQVFDFACWDNGYLEPDQMPARLDKPYEFEEHIKKGKHPHLEWSTFCEELIPKLSANTCNTSRLNNLATKASLLTLTRVSSVVSWKWSWFSPEDNCWIIPADTTGLKRKLSRKRNNEYVHYIPITEEIKTLLNQLRGINGHTEYVFYSQNQKKYPHQHPETINRFLHRNGYKDRLTAQGWRRVVVTSGTEIGGFNRDIIQRQIGQTEHRQGAIGCYEKSQFLDKRREFMNWWSKELVKQGLNI